jgi:hypothetical protein
MSSVQHSVEHVSDAPALADEIAAALQPLLPPGQGGAAASVARVLGAAAARTLTPHAAGAQLGADAGAVALLQGLAGRSVDAGGHRIAFSGDVISVGDIAGGKGLAIGDNARAEVIEIHIHYAAANPGEQRNRAIMVQRVRAELVDGLLADSLAGMRLIDLYADFRPSAVSGRRRPGDTALRLAGPALWGVDSAAEVCVCQGCGLLILGEPGAGKTTMLLDLTRRLLERAERSPDEPIPVDFNLSTWWRDRLPLRDWLVQELAKRYYVPRRQGAAWVDHDQILPLLDGLDEVPASARVACVAAINRFREDHGMSPLFVCCRTAEYEALIAQHAARLHFNGALLVRPLDAGQIDAYLASGGPALAALRDDLGEDAELRRLAETPLMLSLIARIYQGEIAEHLRALPSLEARRRLLFTTYVERMLAAPNGDRRFPPAQTRRWLSHLAAAMQRHALTTFQLDQLQPDALRTPAQRRLYTLIDRLGLGLLLGVPFGIFAGLVCGWTLPVVTQAFAGKGEAGEALGAVNMLVFMAVFMAVGGLFGGTSEQPPQVARGLWWLSRDAILGWLLMAIVAGYTGLLGALGAAALHYELIWALAFALTAGLLGLAAGGLAGAPGVAPRRIALVETLHWSWSQATMRIWSPLGAGLCYGLVYAVGLGMVHPDLGGIGIGLLTGVVFALISAAVAWLRGGLVGSSLEASVAPNQGIWRSARAALIACLVTGVCLTVIVGLGVGLLFIGSNLLIDRDFGKALRIGLANSLAFGSIYGLGTGLIVGLTFGGYAFCSHFALRLVLWGGGAMPWRMVPFLDHCARRLLLRKVGGGYMFPHQLLREYVASLGEGPARSPSGAAPDSA